MFWLLLSRVVITYFQKCFGRLTKLTPTDLSTAITSVQVHLVVNFQNTHYWYCCHVMTFLSLSIISHLSELLMYAVYSENVNMAKQVFEINKNTLCYCNNGIKLGRQSYVSQLTNNTQGNSTSFIPSH